MENNMEVDENEAVVTAYEMDVDDGDFPGSSSYGYDSDDSDTDGYISTPFQHEQDSDMHTAIRAKDITKILELVKNGDSFCIIKRRAGCFKEACDTNDWSLVEKLIEIQPSAVSNIGSYLIFRNIYHPDRVQYLYGVGVNFNNVELSSLLTKCGDSDAPSATMQIILNRCIDFCTTFYNTSYEPLVKTCAYKEKSAESVKKVQMLIAAKDDIAASMEEIDSLLVLLQSSEFNEFSLQIMDELLSAGADVNARNKGHSLLRATCIKDPDMALLAVQKLVDAGATDVNPALSRAATIWCPYVAYEIMRSLIKAGAGLLVSTSEALSLVCKRHEELAIEMVKLLSNPQIKSSPRPILAMALSKPTKSNLSARDKDGNSPLILATEIQNARDAFDSVQFLLKAGIDPNIKNNLGNTALHSACAINCDIFGPLMVNALLEANANPSISNNENNTPLLLATKMDCQKTAVKIMTMLIKAGANVNVSHKIDGTTPLHFASTLHDPNVVTLLIAAGSKISARDKSGRTPLMCAVGYFRSEKVVEITKLLLQAGSRANLVDKKGWTPLHHAASWSSLTAGPTIVELLLKSDADPTKQCKSGNTPLHYVFRLNASTNMKPYFETVQLLLEAGSDPCALNNDSENVLFSFYSNCQFDEQYFPQIFQKFIDLGIDISARNRNKETPLMKCVISNASNNDIGVKKLLEAGACPSDQNIYGVSTLMLSVDSKTNLNQSVHKIVKLLLTAGADVNAVDKKGNTVYNRLSAKTPLEALIELFKVGVSPENAKIQDVRGVNFLTCSIFDKNLISNPSHSLTLIDVIKAMVTAGVDFSAKDHKNYTPLMNAIKNANKLKNHTLPIVNELLKSNVDPRFTTKCGYSALLFAVREIDNTELAYECVTAILNTGANPFLGQNTKEGYMLVQEACRKEHATFGPRLVNALLNALRSTGTYVFQQLELCLRDAIDAVSDPDVALANVESLLEAGADPLESVKNGYNTIEFVACVSAYYNRGKIMKCLMQHVGLYNPQLAYLKLEHRLKSFLTSKRLILNQFARLLKIIGKQNYCGDIEDLRYDIDRLFDYGFTVQSENPNHISALTSLLAIFLSEYPHYFSDKEMDDSVSCIMEKFIKNGADPFQRLFTFKDKGQQLQSQLFQLPDALWLSAILGFKKCVCGLLSNWPAPPLALVAFMMPGSHQVSSYYSGKICQLLPLLLKGGPLPLGSPILKIVQRVIEVVVATNNIDSKDFDYSRAAIKEIQQMDRVVPTLFDMSHVKVRGCFTGGVDLPDRISRLPVPKDIIEILNLSFLQPSESSNLEVEDII